MDKDLERRVADAYADQVIRATPEVLQRILERRASGERVPTPGPNVWRYRLLAGGVAASLLVFAGLSGRKEKSPTLENPVASLAGASLMPQMLMAQGSAHPAYPVMSLDGREVRAGEWSYATLLRGAQYSDTTAATAIRVTSSTYSGKPAWVVLSRFVRSDAAERWLDTAWVDSTDLHLMARSTSVMRGEGRVVEEFRDGEVLKGFSIGGTTSWTVIAADPGAPDSSGEATIHGDVFFMALRRAPLSPTWRGSIQVLGTPIYNRAVRRWFDLAVVGEERITVPAGDFDCWKIRFGPPRDYPNLGAIYIWVSKDRQWVVKRGMASGPQGELWSVLVSGQEK